MVPAPFGTIRRLRLGVSGIRIKRGCTFIGAKKKVSRSARAVMSLYGRVHLARAVLPQKAERVRGRSGGSDGARRWPQRHPPAAAVPLDVLGQVVAAHEAPVAQLAAEPLLARVSPAVSRELVGARKAAPAPCPLTPERAFPCVGPDVSLEVGALEVRLATARVRADVGAAAFFRHGHWSGVDE